MKRTLLLLPLLIGAAFAQDTGSQNQNTGSQNMESQNTVPQDPPAPAVDNPAVLPGTQPEPEAPTPTTPAPDVLTLSAAPGTTVNYASMTQASFSFSDLKLEALPGKRVSARAQKELAKAQAEFKKMNAAPPAQHINQTLRAQVRPSLADGSAVVEYHQQLSLPRLKSSQPTELVWRQISAPGGKTRLELLEAKNGDPQVNKLLKTLFQSKGVSDLASQADQSFYGQPLTVGQVRQLQVNLDFGSLFGNVGAAFGTTFKISGQLPIEQTTTYTGRDAAGHFLFNGVAKATPSKLRFGDQQVQLQMNVERLNVYSRSSYRPDGLSSGSRTTTNGTMSLSLPGPDSTARIILTLQMSQTTEVQEQAP